MSILCRRGKFEDTEKVIRYHPIGIGIGIDMSVPESTTGSTEMPKHRTALQNVNIRLIMGGSEAWGEALS